MPESEPEPELELLVMGTTLEPDEVGSRAAEATLALKLLLPGLITHHTHERYKRVQ